MSEELKKGILKGTTVGHVNYSDEEKKQHDRDFEKILKEYGVLKPNESINKLKHPK